MSGSSVATRMMCCLQLGSVTCCSVTAIATDHQALQSWARSWALGLALGVPGGSQERPEPFRLTYC